MIEGGIEAILIAPIRSAKGETLLGVLGHAPLAKILKLKFCEIQSSAF